MQQLQEVKLTQSNWVILKENVYDYFHRGVDFLFFVLAEVEAQL